MRKLVIGSEFFTWHKDTQRFTSDASCLEAEMQRLGFARLNYEYGKWGFHMKSVRTGRELFFVRTREQRDTDGDLQAVEFVASELPQVRVIVFND